MKPQTIQRILNETVEFVNTYIVKTANHEYRLTNDECNLVEVNFEGLLVYRGDDGTIWIECEKIESIEI